MKNNKQQTPLHVLIDELISRKENIVKNASSIPRHILEGGVMAFESAIDLAQSLLEKEKEQMIEFGQSYAVIHCMGDITKNAEEYYNKTYGGGEQ
jgi:hypothetical protein